MVLTASDGTVAAKPPMIGSDRVTVPPSAVTRSATVVSDACHCWTMTLTGGGGGGGGGGSTSAPAGAPERRRVTAATRPTTSRPSLLLPPVTTVRALQRTMRECCPH